MSCSSCGTDGSPAGCGSNGSCSSGSCNRKNAYDWLADVPLSYSEQSFDIIEVSFKNGAHKHYFKNAQQIDLYQGDSIVVETNRGFDVGIVSLKGELVKLQLKKRKLKSDDESIRKILRKASEQDLELMQAARQREMDILGKSRDIARNLNLNMKVGDIEIQADGKKATFYYTADSRVDFRELVKQYAKEFKLKVEMRQIGPRQEAGRIGGIGDCGRELCCSTWLMDFKTVSTNAARYQNLSINTDKLSGQCGRLKCCLNYELDCYMDALKGFPKKADRIKTKEGVARLRKKDIFKNLMWYSYKDSGILHKLEVDTVHELLSMIEDGKVPESLNDFTVVEEVQEESEHEDLVGQISLNTLEKSGRKKRSKNRRRSNQSKGQQQGNANSKQQKPKQQQQGKQAKKQQQPQAKSAGDNQQQKTESGKRNNNRNRNQQRRRRNNNNNNKGGDGKKE